MEEDLVNEFRNDEVFRHKDKWHGTEETDLKGEENELRGYLLACDLIQKLEAKYPELIYRARCPKAPRLSSKDKHGEDFRVRLEVNYPGGKIEKGYVVYDVASSFVGKNKKLKKRRNYFKSINSRDSIQDKHARAVKILVVNEKIYDLEIQKVILKDLINCDLLPRWVTIK